jgi:Flp pilus assembly protein TadG
MTSPRAKAPADSGTQPSRRQLYRLRGERGSASLEMAIVFPVVLLLIMTSIQAALWFCARSIALGAAQEGAREGRLQPTSTERAQAAADSFLDRAGQDLINERDVSVAGSPTAIEVTVTGRSLSLVPGLDGWSVSQTAVGPIEQLTP